MNPVELKNATKSYGQTECYQNVPGMQFETKNPFQPEFRVMKPPLTLTKRILFVKNQENGEVSDFDVGECEYNLSS